MASTASIIERAKPITYRVQGVPIGYDTRILEGVLRPLLDINDDAKLSVQSLAKSLYNDDTSVATVTFEGKSKRLQGEEGRTEWELPVVGTVQQKNETRLSVIILTIDSHFIGFTPLNECKSEETDQIDCIAVTGLAGHAYGSWKDHHSQHMWLRDTLPNDFGQFRVITYGYNSRLEDSKNAQGIEEIAGEFVAGLAGIRRCAPGTLPRPIFFLAHSLGGLVLKAGLNQMKVGRPIDRSNFKATYAIVFFGVPNRGIENTALRAMVKGQPNEKLVENLAPKAPYLEELHGEFCRSFVYSTSKIFSIYETEHSPTPIKEGDRWVPKGAFKLLVDKASATDSLPQEPEKYQQAITQNHSNIVKYSKNDLSYRIIKDLLQDATPAAIEDISERFPEYEVRIHGRYIWIKAPLQLASGYAEGGIRVLVGAKGLESACSNSSKGEYTTLDTAHLDPQSRCGTWFACAVAGLKSLRELKADYQIEAPFLATAKHDTIPRGVVVRLGLLEPTTSAEREDGWRDAWIEDERDTFEQLARIRNRAEEGRARDQSHRDSGRKKWAFEQNWKAQALKAVLRSAPLHNRSVSEASYKFFQKEGLSGAKTIEELAEEALYLMIQERAVADGITEMLEKWLHWSSTKAWVPEDLTYLGARITFLGYAACMLTLIAENYEEKQVSF